MGSGHTQDAVFTENLKLGVALTGVRFEELTLEHCEGGWRAAGLGESTAVEPGVTQQAPELSWGPWGTENKRN